MLVKTCVVLLCVLSFSGALKRRLRNFGLAVDNKNPFNPGSCKKTSHGQIKLVKDRLGKERLIMCTKESEGFFWKSLDGSSTVGEYFDPALDCSDIVDRIPNAVDGFYWIKLPKSKKAVKVWCDVVTDGGGFMLVAKKNDAVTWTVPSTPEPVSPTGKPHWSSILGKLKMLEIRIKFSTTSSFKDTKADWSLRLRNKRPFNQLLIRDRGGCTKRHPGIGDVAFVKDLQTGKIVNANFQCSLFGRHSSALTGWVMMNKCLRKACSRGFVFFPGLNIKLDDSGSFSYSAHNNATRSGILHKSTAFIGCSSGKCCACYGPKGGTNNYCSSRCTAINGGTITKKVYAWIWIRSSLPKRTRVWKKCIEYTVRGANGKDEIYNINHETGIPEKGSCASPGYVKQNSPILVGSSNKAVNKVPPVPGLLLYRPGKEQLFVQGRGRWNMIAMEKKVQRKQQQFVKGQKQVERKVIGVEKEVQALKNNISSLQISNVQRKQQQIERGQRKLVNKLLAMEKQMKLVRKNAVSARPVSNGLSSCKQLKSRKSTLSNGYYRIGTFWVYCDMSNNGWSLVARFSNKDYNNWIAYSHMWYDRFSSFGATTNPFYNGDMISEAFWKVEGNNFKITRSDDSSHTALLQTTSNCLAGNTFRQKITSYGNFRNRAVWASNQCRGSCRVRYGGKYQSTAGFSMHSCSSNIQSSNYIGFWCDWSGGDGAVMMIGGGGTACNRADHGIGITEHDDAKFGPGNTHHDFGDIHNFISNAPSIYSLNLWVR